MDFSHSALFFDLSSSFEFSIYSYLFVHSFTTCFLVILLADFLGISVKYSTYFSFTIHSVNITNPIQLSFSDKWKYSCINSLLYRFLQFSFTLIPPNIHLTFLSKAASHLAISVFNVQDSALYVSTGFVNVL